ETEAPSRGPRHRLTSPSPVEVFHTRPPATTRSARGKLRRPARWPPRCPRPHAATVGEASSAERALAELSVVDEAAVQPDPAFDAQRAIEMRVATREELHGP